MLRPMTGEELSRWYAGELAEAFPPSERKPLPEIQQLRAAGRYEPLGRFDGGVLAGYATLWSHPAHPGYVLLDYLGVSAPLRGRGVGASILGELRTRFAGRALVITEAEAPLPGGDGVENALRARRIGFYERCGFRRVYLTAACGGRFQALVLGEPPGDLSALMEAHRAIYGPERDDIEIPLGPDGTARPPYWMKKEEST